MAHVLFLFCPTRHQRQWLWVLDYSQARVEAGVQPLLSALAQLPDGEDALEARGEGLYRWHSCINHSCRPNLEQVPHSTGSRVVLKAIVDIPAGAALSLSYVALPQAKAARRTELATYYDFECACVACVSE